ncbi:MAG: asparagine synthase-related protein [Anaerolineaceae bacterium]
MALTENQSLIGDFSIFGFSKNPDYLVDQMMLLHLGVVPKKIDFGQVGKLFYYSTYGDLAESEQTVVLKLGFIRSITKSPLSAQQLISKKIVNQGYIDHNAIRGNALIVSFGKTDPIFSAYKTMLGIPQLYYTIVDGGIICSDRLLCIVRLLDKPEINENIIPMHFLFRSVPGDLTYYRQIQRLLPGELLQWTDRNLYRNLVQDMRVSDFSDVAQPRVLNTEETLYEHLRYVVGDYVAQVEQKGEYPINLLSGGVDSSLLQFLLNMQTGQQPSKSLSFAVQVPDFLHEIEYASQASQLFRTEHTFVDIKPSDYPDLISRTIEALAQPPILETEPGMLSIAEYANKNKLSSRFFVSGQGADALFGCNLSVKLKGLHMMGKIPGSTMILKSMGVLLKPFTKISRMLCKGGEILSLAKDQDDFFDPVNSIFIYANLDTLRHCFGDTVLHNSLRYRRELAGQYLDTDHYLERIHIIDLLTDAYEVEIQRQQLFLSQKREKIHPFFDDDILRAGFAIPTEKRFIKGFRPKYLLKDILQKKTGSPAAHKPKGFSIWENDLLTWMESGPLKPMVREIKLPGFMTRKELESLQKTPTYFLWELLVFDLFQQFLQFSVKR